LKRKEKLSLPKPLKRVMFAGIENWLSGKLLRRDRSEAIVLMAILGYTAVFSYFTILRFQAFNTHAWDLGIFDQSFWTTAHSGQLFVSTVEQFIIPSGCFFGTHFSPVLFFILPFYSVFSAPQTLLVAQSFILALGAVPLYFFAKNSLNNKTIAVAFSVAYLLYPPLHGVNWFDFHAQAFLPLFFFSTFFFLFKEKWPQYFLFVVLSLMVAENVPITVAFIGLYCCWRFRKQIVNALKTHNLDEPKLIVPVVTIGLSIVWFFFARWISQTYFPFDVDYTNLFKAVDNWRELGISGDPLLLPYYSITRLFMIPGTINALLYDYPLKLLYLFLLFGPLLFLSIRSSIAAISLAWIVPALLSNYSPYYVIGDHFPAYPLAFLFLAAVEALRPKPQEQIPSALLRRLRRLSQLLFRWFGSLTRIRRIVSRCLRLPGLKTCKKLLLLGSVLFALIVSPLSPVMIWAKNEFPYFGDYYMPVVTRHDQIEQQIVDLVPAGASILTTNSIFPHFSSRLNAYVYPLDSMIQNYGAKLNETYIILGLFGNSTFVMTDTSRALDNYTSYLINLSINETFTDFRVRAQSDDGICLYEKGYLGDILNFTA
jgi:uncharacterized membrane protein